ncbi:hypothetical protein [Psychrobacillus lasiicapitis]|uniref:DUF3221 domain-containing protein n=1 Tax=Psychrobacillus lasiicapitis TaxID=1636719 RepID=A0A544SVL4_9BACI|nr:hypothetical protein [Psychrobacillus lasiicapitis]TQR09171.1 hypothetical protein FG382_20455 [Psychrobacillus lasiicapitis]GGA48081.1 hypothetical protein GCM10011384_42230 [Psychrobacillus lasiicapitis]
MKKIGLFLLCIMLLVACGSQTIIEWVDFVKINGKQYDAVYTAVISDSVNIGEKVGEVKFRVADNVSNPSYRIKEGDAAYWEKGTEIYSVKDRERLIAIPDASEINGYRIYKTDENNLNYHYKDIALETINKVEIYEGDYEQQLAHTIVNEQEVAEIIAILNDGETNPSFNPNTAYGDPTRFQVVLYSEEPIAYNFSIYFDGNVWFWHPWDTSIISDEIEGYIKNNE